MRAARFASVALVGLALLGSACEFQAQPVFGPKRPREPEDDSKARLPTVQAAACLSTPVEATCAFGLRVVFAPRADDPSPNARAGELYCGDDGHPRARFTKPEPLEGPVSQSVWEAVWRTLDATRSCALAYGGPVGILRGGNPQPCDAPRFEIKELFEKAWVATKLGPPPGDPSVDRCAVDPESCTNARSKICPELTGDPWAGVTRGQGSGSRRSGDPQVERPSP